MIRDILGSWKLLAVRGGAAVLLGIATLVWPDVSLWALVVLWGAFAFVDGITALTAAIADRLLVHRVWVGLWGGAGIAAGLVTLVWPSITALTLLIVIATWSFIIGGSLIGIGISERKTTTGAGSMIFSGVLLVALGTLLVISPGDGALGLTWAIGSFALLFGCLELSLAVRVHRDTRPLRRLMDQVEDGHRLHALS